MTLPASDSRGAKAMAETSAKPSPVFSPPGPGQWRLDPTHQAHAEATMTQDLLAFGLRDGLRRAFAELGVPADTIDSRFVNGFRYTRVRPLMNPDQPAQTLPHVMLKAAMRVHPEMRKRAATAVRNGSDSVLVSTVARWQSSIRPDLEHANDTFAQVHLNDLRDDALAGHLQGLHAHCLTAVAFHYELYAFTVGPIGQLLVDGHKWGFTSTEMATLLVTVPPVTTAVGALRSRVGNADQKRFDLALTQARQAIDLRDHNAMITVERPLRLLRTAILDAGRRVHAQPGRGMLSALGKLFRPAHALELTLDEVVGLLRGELLPSGSTVDTRAEQRQSLALIDPPTTLGPQEPPLPLDVLPPALANQMRLVDAVINARHPAASTHLGTPDALDIIGEGFGRHPSGCCGV